MTHAFGDESTVRWIRESCPAGLSIGAAIPPGFAAYATIVIPDETGPHRQHDAVLVEVLEKHSSTSQWWLGFLDTGADPLPFAGAGTVAVYGGWQFQIVGTSPDEALRLRENVWYRTLPDLIFPDDRAWLVSTLWDDDWRCVGGPEALIKDLSASDALETRTLSRDQDATPPGHIAR